MAIDTLKSIMDEIVSFKNKHFSFKKSGNGSYLDRSSISKATKDLVASFPVICSDTISAPTASMIAKATERNCVVMLQLLFSSAYLKGESGREVLSKWHTNMDGDMNMDDLLDIMDTFGEDAKIISDVEANQIYREMAPVISKYINSLNEFYPESSFSEHSIQDYIIREDSNGYTMVMQMLHEKRSDNIPGYSNKNLNYTPHNPFQLGNIFNSQQMDTNTIAAYRFDMERFYNDINARTAEEKNAADLALRKAALDFQEDQFDHTKLKDEAERIYKDDMLKLQKLKNRQDRIDKANQHNLQKDKFAHQQMDSARKYQLDKDKFDFEKQKFAYQQGQDAIRQIDDDLRNGMDFFQKQLLSTDVKKYNELVPSLIVIRFQAVDSEDPRNHRPDSQAILGVKTRLVPVDSFDIINNIRSIEKNKISLANLIRATTGEIHFCKDFVAAIDQAKIDAKNNSRLAKSSPIWRSLQNRSMGSTMRRLKKNRANDAGAITTLVMSIEEVNVLKKDYDIDLTNPKKAKFVMEQYNLLSFVIVDEQVEVARFLYDGEKYFQDYSFGVLERETGDSSYKKVINLISKVNRG